jgi:hypothetical protein
VTPLRFKTGQLKTCPLALRNLVDVHHRFDERVSRWHARHAKFPDLRPQTALETRAVWTYKPTAAAAEPARRLGQLNPARNHLRSAAAGYPSVVMTATHSALRQPQKALSLATCIQVAAEHCDDGAIDFADALSGLLTVVQVAAA